jgi:hypothetical protein
MLSGGEKDFWAICLVSGYFEKHPRS